MKARAANGKHPVLPIGSQGSVKLLAIEPGDAAFTGKGFLAGAFAVSGHLDGGL